MTTIEYARVKTAEGSPVPRTEAARSAEKFRVALAQRGGSMPPGMRWNEARGFYYPELGSRSAGGSGRLTVREATARHAQVAREIRHEAVSREISAYRGLLRAASPLAWRWARLFRSGRALGWGASHEERAGWELARLGYDAPPLWLLQEQLDRTAG